ncbi:hypothetical protein [Ensifer adhaerens]|uniref:hypothetical protein n=1 Tax=Ensifer adhaerens TaxID=106592 RepID=UPI000CF17052|nr:hypothetical protein [Ensifer adhaerens]
MITRQELYDLVWSDPGKAAASKLGVSDSYLNRVCTALDVPRPPRGWWMKRKAGRAPPRPPLPPAPANRPECWTKGGAGVPPLKAYYRRDVLGSGPVPPGTHRLVAYAREIFTTAKKSLDGSLVVNWNYDSIDLTVSEEGLQGGLRLANALFLGLERRGHDVVVARRSAFIRPPISNWGREPSHLRGDVRALWTPRNPTIARIGGVAVGLAILEVFEEAEMRYVGGGVFVPARRPPPAAGIHWTEWRRIPQGRLKLAAYSPHHPLPWLREWTEKRRNSFERSAAALVTALEAAAAELGEARAVHDRKRLGGGAG